MKPILIVDHLNSIPRQSSMNSDLSDAMCIASFKSIISIQSMNRAERIAMQNLTRQRIEAIYDMEVQLNERIDQLRRKMSYQLILLESRNVGQLSDVEIYRRSIRLSEEQTKKYPVMVHYIEEAGDVSREQFDRVKSRGVHLSIDKQGKVDNL